MARKHLYLVVTLVSALSILFVVIGGVAGQGAEPIPSADEMEQPDEDATGAEENGGEPSPRLEGPQAGQSLVTLPHSLARERTSPHPWPQEAHDMLRSALTNVTGPWQTPVLPEPWPFLADGNLTAPPVIGEDGTAYAGSDAGTVVALAPTAGGAAGLALWEFTTGAPVVGPLALKEFVTGDFGPSPVRLLAATANGDVIALDPQKGTEIWSLNLGASIPDTASLRVYTDEGSGYATLFLTAGDLLYVIRESGNVAAPAASILWVEAVPSVQPVTVHPSGNWVYVVYGDQFVIFQTADGDATCQSSLGGAATAPVMDPAGVAYTGAANGALYILALDPTTCDGDIGEIFIGGAVVQPPSWTRARPSLTRCFAWCAGRFPATSWTRCWRRSLQVRSMRSTSGTALAPSSRRLTSRPPPRATRRAPTRFSPCWYRTSRAAPAWR